MTQGGYSVHCYIGFTYDADVEKTNLKIGEERQCDFMKFLHVVIYILDWFLSHLSRSLAFIFRISKHKVVSDITVYN